MLFPNVKKILILKWGALGDLVMITSSIKAVRENFPNAEITMFTNSIMKEILPEGYLIDKYILIKKSGRNVDESLFKQMLLVMELRRREFDLAIDLKWISERAAVITYLSGAKIRVGYWSKYFHRCYTHTLQYPKGPYHELDRGLDVLKSIDLKISDANPVIFISDENKKLADDFFRIHSLKKEDVICLHPGASKLNRAWPAEHYIGLSKKFIEKYNSKILITWGKNEFELVNNISKQIGKNVFITPSTHTIAQLAALIQNCGMYISGCTGPMNVANAVKTPIIALLSATDPLDWAPYGDIHRTIRTPLIRETYTDEQEQEAMQAITVDSVWEVASKRWDELKNDKL
jgi:heptosyltransferase-3